MMLDRSRSATCTVLLGVLACGPSKRPPACGDASLLATPTDLAARGPWPVGVRTVQLDGRPVEVWYPARRDTPDTAPRVRYDLRLAMPPAEAAKVPDADNAWLECDCVRDVEVDVSHGPYPVVMFLHGAASFRMQSTFLTTHWASRGFVVIAPDLPGVGLNAILGGEPTMFPALIPGSVLDAIAKPSGTDPFAFIRDRLDTGRVAVVGHSLGSVLARSVDTRPEITVKISLAGANTFTSGSNLSVGGETDKIAPPDRDPARLADAPPRSRSAVVRGAGHLAFTDLCLVGADRGGSLAIARTHGVAIPDMIVTLAVDGCRSTDAPFSVTAPAIRALTSGVLEESLFCDSQKTRAIQALGRSPQIELVER